MKNRISKDIKQVRNILKKVCNFLHDNFYFTYAFFIHNHQEINHLNIFFSNRFDPIYNTRTMNTNDNKNLDPYTLNVTLYKYLIDNTEKCNSRHQVLNNHRQFVNNHH